MAKSTYSHELSKPILDQSNNHKKPENKSFSRRFMPKIILGMLAIGAGFTAYNTLNNRIKEAHSESKIAEILGNSGIINVHKISNVSSNGRKAIVEINVSPNKNQTCYVAMNYLNQNNQPSLSLSYNDALGNTISAKVDQMTNAYSEAQATHNIYSLLPKGPNNSICHTLNSNPTKKG